MSKFYITTTLPYVNAEPHIGFALEIIQADVVARWHKEMGDEVFFNFGTDEHGQKIYEKAIEQHKDPQEYCDEYASKFGELKTALNLSYNNFIRTTDPHHIKAAQEFWKRCNANRDIYKKLYQIKYCIGCELEKTDSELVDGKCPIHPNKELEIREEENYFFKFSKYQKPILELYKNSEFVIPQSKLQEIKAFVENGLQDFSISRLKEKMPWGVPVPGDDQHVMYVWFDALVNYISAIGWPDDMDKFNQWWPVVQVAGKDNLRQQSAMWQAMLMSAGIAPSKQIFIHGFLTNEGQKISKSLGNTINPIEVANQFGTDALRYYLLAKFSPSEDGDFSIEKLKETYNSDLANGLGNTVARLAKLAEKSGFTLKKTSKTDIYNKEQIEALNGFAFNVVLNNIWIANLTTIDQHINMNTPWTIKEPAKLEEILQEEIDMLVDFAYKIKPFMPQTAEKIIEQFTAEKIIAQAPLFPRIV